MRILIIRLVVALILMDIFAVGAEPGTRPAPRRPLSRMELRQCMDRSAELRGRADSLRAAQTEHNTGMAELSEEATALSKLLRNLDNADEVAVDLYNKRNDARNAKVDVSNARARALNVAVADLQSAESDFVTECVARPYLKSDEDAILKEGVKGRKPLAPGESGPSRGTPSRYES